MVHPQSSIPIQQGTVAQLATMPTSCRCSTTSHWLGSVKHLCLFSWWHGHQLWHCAQLNGDGGLRVNHELPLPHSSIFPLCPDVAMAACCLAASNILGCICHLCLCTHDIYFNLSLLQGCSKGSHHSLQEEMH